MEFVGICSILLAVKSLTMQLSAISSNVKYREFSCLFSAQCIDILIFMQETLFLNILLFQLLPDLVPHFKHRTTSLPFQLKHHGGSNLGHSVQKSK